MHEPRATEHCRVPISCLPNAGLPSVVDGKMQYDLTPDTHFIVARHPDEPSWWLLGGGSGHGFKHGPALAEYVVDCVEGRRDPEPFHRLGSREGHAGLRTAERG
jgi:glycine/D-amino acid oxidase-like deaminating enzyme